MTIIHSDNTWSLRKSYWLFSKFSWDGMDYNINTQFKSEDVPQTDIVFDIK